LVNFDKEGKSGTLTKIQGYDGRPKEVDSESHDGHLKGKSERATISKRAGRKNNNHWSAIVGTPNCTMIREPG